MKVYLETYGCQMNEYDSELIRSILHQGGYGIVPTIEEANIVLLNTCAVRENAHQKIFHRLDHLRSLKTKKQIQIIGVLGCMAQSLRQQLAEEASCVDIVAGPDSYKRLPELIQTVCQDHTKGFDFSLSEYETYTDIGPQRLPGVNAWIAIMRGCNNFCSFCVVPYTRGRERSRSPQDIIGESELIVAEGFKQITLLGQNVNSYKYEDSDFADLMQAVGEIPDLRRVRFTSPHPKDFSRKLLHVMAANPKLCKQIHLPLQAGSNRILERMHRNYTRQEFYDLVDEIRAILPEVSLTTDIICGFCGETEDEFLKTMEVVERVEFDSAFIFKYSERKNTIASRKYPDDIPEEAKVDRVMRLNELQRSISRKRNEAEIGKTFEVLIEGQSKKNPEEWLGRNDQNKGVVFKSPQHAPGDFVKVKITHAGTHTLIGESV